MVPQVLLLLLVFGPSRGQRDIVVNRRARQKLDLSTQVQPDSIDQTQRTAPVETRRRVLSRGRSYADSVQEPYLEQPYLERGASERYNSFGDRSLSTHSSALSDLTPPGVALEIQTPNSGDTPYFERGQRHRQRLSEESRELVTHTRQSDIASDTLTLTQGSLEVQDGLVETSNNIKRTSDNQSAGVVRRRTDISRQVIARQRSRDFSTNGASQFIADPEVKTGRQSLEVEAFPGRSRTRLRSTGAAAPTPRREEQDWRTSTQPPVQRTRGRSRFVSKGSPSGDLQQNSFQRSEPRLEVSNRPSQPTLRANSRPEVIRGQETQSRATARSLNNRRVDVLQDIETGPPTKEGSRVIFPKRNLIPGLPQITFSKEKESSEPRINRVRSDIKPTKPRPDIQPVTEVQQPEIQSSREEREDYITVTHQIPAKTIFTIFEGKDTKSLYIDTFTTSLQAISIRDLKSTYIDDSPVIYAHSVLTQSFGIQETLYDAINPTRTVISPAPSVAGPDSSDTVGVSTKYSTIYNVQTITVRDTESLVNLPPDIASIGSLLQNVILGILGGNLLGAPGSPWMGGALVPQTNYVTHTRSVVATSTSTSTILIPVTLRGSEIFKTVTDTKIKVYTETDLSVETIIQPGVASATSTPFLPLAPTLNRATRVVPTISTYPLLPLIVSPDFSLFVHTSTSVTTIDADVTSDIVITLGGREVQTQFIQPTKQVLTVTTLSTETVTYNQQSPQQSNSLNQLGLLRAILQLQQLNG